MIDVEDRVNMPTRNTVLPPNWEKHVIMCKYVWYKNTSAENSLKCIQIYLMYKKYILWTIYLPCRWNILQLSAWECSHRRSSWAGAPAETWTTRTPSTLQGAGGRWRRRPAVLSRALRDTPSSPHSHCCSSLSDPPSCKLKMEFI